MRRLNAHLQQRCVITLVRENIRTKSVDKQDHVAAELHGAKLHTVGTGMEPTLDYIVD